MESLELFALCLWLVFDWELLLHNITSRWQIETIIANPYVSLHRCPPLCVLRSWPIRCCIWEIFLLGKKTCGWPLRPLRKESSVKTKCTPICLHTILLSTTEIRGKTVDKRRMSFLQSDLFTPKRRFWNKLYSGAKWPIPARHIWWWRRCLEEKL